MNNWRKPWLDYGDVTRFAYAQHIGHPTAELVTPALVVDIDVLERNIGVMADTLRDVPAMLRPHTKVQKSPDIARLQLEAGAIGVTVASIWEAAAMGAAGVDDVLIANEIVGSGKIRAAAQLARRIRLTVVVDDLRNIADLSEACVAEGTRMNVLVDLDVGMARCGARTAAEALKLGRAVAAASNLALVGIQAYEGHCMLEPDRDTRIRLATTAMDYASSVKQILAEDGLSVPTLSGGGTGTYDLTGRRPEVTELQAGSYVFMDAFHGSLVPGFEVSLTVHSTVVARHGDIVILDAGRKSIGIDFVTPSMLGFDYVANFFAEEHGLFDVDDRFDGDVGDRVRLVCGYAPTTVNLHDVMFVAHGGDIVDVWPVFPRGPSHHGFLDTLNTEE